MHFPTYLFNESEYGIPTTYSGWHKKTLPIPYNWDRQGKGTKLYTPILARVVMDFKCVLSILISNLTLSMCMYAYINM